MKIRLVRYLAQCGVASRRKAAELVRDELVAVNGQTTTDLSLAIGPDDKVTFRGRRVKPPSGNITIILNKISGQVCSLADPHNPSTVLDSISKELRGRVKPVGRLDKNTMGLLLLTDDGELAYRLMHPKYGVKKTYRALVRGILSRESLQALRNGVELDDGLTSPAGVHTLEMSQERGASLLDITIHEGRKRQVRRMFEAVGHSVLRLERTAYGPLRLEGVPRNEWRELTAEELTLLRQAVDLENQE